MWKPSVVVFQMLGGLIGLLMATASPAAQPVSEAPYAGTYYCYTTALETDRYANNPVAVRPAFFGKIILDGNGAYTLTAKGQKGRYFYDPRSGQLTFSGFLAASKVSGYAADSFKISYRGPSGTFAYNCTTDGSGDPRASHKASPANVQRLVAGQFEGQYTCSSGGPIAITIRLSADADNNLQGEVMLKPSEPAARRRPARYAVTGRWFKEAVFSIRPDSWLDNPDKLPLPTDWLTGQVDDGGLSHIRMSDSCPNFSLRRV